MLGKYALAIHGGAGTLLRSEITAEQEANYKAALNEALQVGESILKVGGSALDAVEACIKSLEDSPLFNAGRGSVFTHDETHELEASIMDGATSRAGAVAAVSRVKNPIALSRLILHDDEFVYLSGKGAEQYATDHQMKLVDPVYFYTDFRYNQLMAAKKEGTVLLDHDGEKKFGTVGAVALDLNDNLAAGTSTGGLTNKQYGRIGDSSLIGCGCFAENQSCAVSATGYGEYFIRSVVAHDIAALVKYKGLSVQEASDYVIQKKLVKLGGEGGVITVDRDANIALSFNSEGMYRGWLTSDEKAQVAIFKNVD